MKRARLAAVACVVLGAACAHGPSSATVVASAPAEVSPAVQQVHLTVERDSASIMLLMAEGSQHSHVGQDLRYLTDVIGPRLTGSAGVRRANEWTARKLREYGADSVALEPWPFGIGWTRGPLSMRLLQPHERWLQ